MKGVNHVILSGNVTGAKPVFTHVSGGKPACSFEIATHRAVPGGGQVRAYVRINVYVEALVRLCEDRLSKGEYVVVAGELMNRDGQHGELTEVRARELIFLSRQKEDEHG